MPTKCLPLALLVLSVLGASNASAEGKPKCYTTSSFEGSWSIVAEYGERREGIREADRR